MAERLGQQKVRVKSLDEIMAEKRQRASQESVEAPKDKEVAKEEERGLKNYPQRNQQRKPLNRVSGELRKKLQMFLGLHVRSGTYSVVRDCLMVHSIKRTFSYYVDLSLK